MAAVTNKARNGRPPEGPRDVPSFEQLAKGYLEGLGYHVSHGTPGRSLGDFLQCVKDARPESWITVSGQAQYNEQRKYSQHAAADRIEKVYGTGRVVAKAAMAENQGTTGGYLVPLDFSLRLYETLAEESFIYPRATVVPMTEAEQNLPRVDAETATTTAGVSSLLGGIQFKWGSEQAPAETEPRYRQTQLKAWDLLGYAVCSNQWLGDSGPAGEEHLVRLFGRAAAWYAEYAFLQGLGADGQMPLGVINAACAIKTGNNAQKTGRQTAGSITIGDVTVMTSKFLPYSWRHGVWACSPGALTPIQQLAQYFINVELGVWSHRQHPKPVGMLSTLPLFLTEKLPPLGAPGDLVLFDPSLYVIGNRQEILVDVSEHALFQTNQTVFRVWLRMDGKPWLSGPVTLQDATTQVSSVVVLN